jgi:hypothetical protein
VCLRKESYIWVHGEHNQLKSKTNAYTIQEYVGWLMFRYACAQYRYLCVIYALCFLFRGYYVRWKAVENVKKVCRQWLSKGDGQVHMCVV